MNCPQHKLNFSMVTSEIIWPLLQRLTPLMGQRGREGKGEREGGKEEVAENLP